MIFKSVFLSLVASAMIAINLLRDVKSFFIEKLLEDGSFSVHRGRHESWLCYCYNFNLKQDLVHSFQTTHQLKKLDKEVKK